MEENRKSSPPLKLKDLFRPRDGESSRSNRSFLLRLALILLLCMLCLIIFFGFYTSRIITQTEDSRLSMMETSLSFAVESSDSLFQVGIVQPSEVIHNMLSIVALSFSSNEYNINGNSLARAKADLNTVASNSSIMDSAFLYIPNADLVISSSFESTSLAQSEHYKTILTYENNLTPTTRLSFNGYEAHLFRVNGQYFIARDMYVSSTRKQSTLFMLLNMEELTHHIRVSSGMNEAIHFYLYDGQSQILSSSFSELNDQFNPVVINLKGDYSSVLSNDLYVLSKKSDVSSLSFYLAIEKSAIRPSFGSMMSTIIPFALVLFFMVCLIAAFTSFYLYRPFRHTISVLEQASVLPSAEKPAKNDFDYLSTAVASIVSRQEHLSSMLQVVSDDIHSRILYNLINGSMINCDHITSTFEGINSPFRLHATYTVIALEHPLLPDPVKGNFFSALTTCLQHLESVHELSSYVLHMEDGALAIILQFNNADISVVNRRHTIHAVESQLNDELSAYCSDFYLSSGRLYHSLLDISYSYHEAHDAIRDQKLLLDPPFESNSSTAPSESSLTSEISSSTLLSRRIHQIITTCRQEGHAASEPLIDYAVAEVRDATTDSSQLTRIARDMLYSMVSQVTSQEHINPSLIPDVFSEFCTQTNDETDCGNITDLLRQATLRLVDSFDQQLQKQRNPYILSTQEYISQHYKDPSLTLEAIAENVHISSSYLSKLFRSSLGIKLFEYLTRYRIDASLDLLLTSSDSISEIAESVGFSNVRNYIRSFKKYYDCTPGEYRKKHSGTITTNGMNI